MPLQPDNSSFIGGRAGTAQREGIQTRGFPIGTQRCRPFGGGDAIADRCFDLTGLVGVKCQRRQRVRIIRRLRQGGQRAPVQFDSIEVGDLRHSGPTGEFVTKADQFPFGGEHAGVEAFV